MMNLNPVRFAGVHTFISLHKATPREHQIANVEAKIQALSLSHLFSTIFGRDLSVDQDGDVVTLNLKRESSGDEFGDLFGRPELSIKLETFEQDGRMATRVTSEGTNSETVDAFDQMQHGMCTMAVTALNHGVDREPGEKATYNFKSNEDNYAFKGPEHTTEA